MTDSTTPVLYGPLGEPISSADTKQLVKPDGTPAPVKQSRQVIRARMRQKADHRLSDDQLPLTRRARRALARDLAKKAFTSLKERTK